MTVLTTVPTRIIIAGLCSHIPGVVTAFTQIPRMIQDAQLPEMIVLPGPATYDIQVESSEMVLETRLYQLVLLVQNAAFGTSGDLELQCDPFFKSVRDFFLARPGLEELDTQGVPKIPSVLNAKLLGDSGLNIGSFPFQGGSDTPEYVQIIWRLQVQEIAPVTYAD
jgi:hypothetical protein